MTVKEFNQFLEDAQAAGKYLSKFGELTPAIAREIMQSNGRPNRPVNERRVALYAEEIKNGNWKFEGSPLIFNENGALIDGQHRVLAVFKSGQPIETMFLAGMPDERFDYIDTNRANRTLPQLLALRGFPQAQYYASVASLLCQYKHTRLASGHMRGMVSIHEKLRIAEEKRDEIKDSIKVGWRLRHLGPLAHFSLAFILYRRRDPEGAEWFFDRLVDGEGLSKGEPALTLRQKLIRSKSSPANKPRRRQVLAWIFKAINATLRGEKITYIRWNESGPQAEPFPSLVWPD